VEDVKGERKSDMSIEQMVLEDCASIACLKGNSSFVTDEVRSRARKIADKVVRRERITKSDHDWLSFAIACAKTDM
jgi:hypothetical protein